MNYKSGLSYNQLFDIKLLQLPNFPSTRFVQSNWGELVSIEFHGSADNFLFHTIKVWGKDINTFNLYVIRARGGECEDTYPEAIFFKRPGEPIKDDEGEAQIYFGNTQFLPVEEDALNEESKLIFIQLRSL